MLFQLYNKKSMCFVLCGIMKMNIRFTPMMCLFGVLFVIKKINGWRVWFGTFLFRLFDFFDLKTGWQGLLQFFGLLFVSHHQCVQKA